MGVQIYIRDSSRKTVWVAGQVKKFGTVKPLCKVTEVDEARMAKLEAGRAAYKGRNAPVALIVPDGCEFALAFEPARPVTSFAVIGWESGRYDVNDWDWSGCPIVGYAVENVDGELVLHERREDDLLYPLDAGRAAILGLTRRRA